MLAAGSDDGEEDTDRKTQQSNVQQTKFSSQSRVICRLVGELLHLMEDVEQQVSQFKNHIASEEATEKPLYRWKKYDGFRELAKTVDAVEEVVAKSKPAHLPAEFVKTYCRRARSLSTHVSHMTASIMMIMREVSETCFKEVDSSSLSAESKDDAKTAITGEIAKVIQYCADATEQIWAARDRLDEHLLTDEQNMVVSADTTKKRRPVIEEKRCTSYIGLVTNMAGFFLVAFSAGLIALCVIELGARRSFMPRAHVDSMYADVLGLVHRAQLITTRTDQLYLMRLKDSERRLQELEAASDTDSQRLDSLEETMGPTDAVSVASEPVFEVPDDIRKYIRKIATEQTRRDQRLEKDTQELRKHVHRVDLRLTARMNKVEKKNGWEGQ